MFWALLLCFSVRADAAPAYYRSYSDIRTHTELQTAAEWARLSDVMRGKTKAKFGPKSRVTGRTVVRALQILDPTYSAVASGRYQAGTKTAGIAKNGKGVTREAFAVSLFRYAKSHGASVSKKKKLTGFSDYGTLSAEARTAYSWAYRNELVAKAVSNRLGPKKYVTREEAVLAFYRLHKLLPNYRADLGSASDFRQIVLREIAEVVPYGGYSTSSSRGVFSQTAWQGLNKAYKMKGSRPVIDPAKARPSFCSLATYLILVRSVLTWDTYENTGARIPKSAWVALKPYCVSGLTYPAQGDGVGAWGRANANGPGMAVLIRDMGAGQNTVIGKKSEYRSESAYWSAWGEAQPGDFLKIFRSDAIGANERGHMVVYLGSQYAARNGVRDDIIWYWSSNGSGTDASKGYYITSCRASAITRGVITRVTSPQAFANADSISPTDKDSWLASLLTEKNVSVAEMKKHI